MWRSASGSPILEILRWRRRIRSQEIEANRLARDWLIDPEALRPFVTATEPYFSRERVIAFAEDQGRHPGIVVGRLQHEEVIPWKNLRELLVGVADYLERWIDRVGPGG